MPPWPPSWILELNDLVSPQCLPSNFTLNWLMVWEEMWFEIQDGHHLEYWNRMILAILSFPNAQCPPSSLSSIRLIVQEQMWFEDQDGCQGGHLGYQNGTNLVILNLHAAPMPSTKFLLHQTYGSGAGNNWRLSRWPPWWSSWIRFWWRCPKCERTMVNRPWHKLIWSKAPGELTIEDLQDGCCGGHCGYRKVLAQSELSFGSRWGLKIFKMATLGAILDIGTEQF